MIIGDVLNVISAKSKIAIIRKVEVEDSNKKCYTHDEFLATANTFAERGKLYTEFATEEVKNISSDAVDDIILLTIE